MSLRVWLPLNGNINNYGISDVTVTNNGATVDNNGKIGKCYNFDGTDDYISLTSTLIYDIIKGGSTPFSIAMWIYRSDATRAILFGDYNLSNAINFNLELSTSHTVRFYWSASPDLYLSNAILAQSAWNHLTVTYDGLCIKCYINGILKQSSNVVLSSKTKSSGAYYIGRDSRTGTTAFNGKMNDFRIYDHCLSQKEVKEISKGLCLHYKLSGPGQENLIDTENPIKSSTSNGTISSINKSIALDFSQNRDTYIFFNFKPNAKLTVGETYTLSFMCSGLGTSDNISFAWENIQSCHIDKKQYKIKNGYNYFTFIEPSDNRGFMDDIDRISNSTVTLSHFKLEKGSVATPWCPNSFDPLYSTLGYNNNIEDDCSGYSNNGTKSGTITCESNSPRYATSYKFNGSSWITSTANGTIPAILNSGTFTISSWVKPSVLNTEPYKTFFCCRTPSGSTQGCQVYFALRPTYILYSQYSDDHQIPYTFNINEWYHIAATFSNKTAIFYVNGVQVSSVSLAVKSSISNNGVPTVGADSDRTGRFNGNISDFRIYATALSANDIKQLYNSPISVDKSGNLFASEFNNTQITKSSFGKNGIINSNEYLEYGEKVSMSIGKDCISTNELIEF